MKSRRLIFIILSLCFVFHGCEYIAESWERLPIHNDSEMDCVFILDKTPTGDTPSIGSDVMFLQKHSTDYFWTSRSWKRVLGDETALFIILDNGSFSQRYGTVSEQFLSEINESSIIGKYELTKPDIIDKLRQDIHFPPSSDMKDMKMDPPYETLKEL